MKRREAERGVRKLTDDEENRDHQFFYISCPECGETFGRTHLSHGAKGQEIGHRESDMARQLGIPLALFRELADCSKGQPEYLAARGHDHSP